MDIIYRKYKTSDIKHIINLLSYSRTDKEAYSEFMTNTWDWFYFENPYALKNGADILVCEGDGRIIGAIGILNEILLFLNKEMVVGWGIHLITDPGIRGKGIGKELIRRWIKVQDISLAKGISDAAFYIEKKLGFIPKQIVKKFEFNYRSRTLSAKEIIKVIYSRVRLCLTQKYPKEYTLELLDKIDSESESQINDFLSNLMLNISQDHIVVKKDIGYIKWRYFGTPFLSHKIALLKFRQTIRAIVILIKKPNDIRHLILQEIFFSKEDSFLIRSTLKQLVNHLAYRNPINIITTAHSCDYIKNELSSAGFRPLKEFSRFNVFSRDPNIMETLLTIKPWYISLGDSDGSYLTP